MADETPTLRQLNADLLREIDLRLRRDGEVWFDQQGQFLEPPMVEVDPREYAALMARMSQMWQLPNDPNRGT